MAPLGHDPRHVALLEHCDVQEEVFCVFFPSVAFSARQVVTVFVPFERIVQCLAFPSLGSKESMDEYTVQHVHLRFLRQAQLHFCQ